MKRNFFCQSCEATYQSDGVRKERIDPVFGPVTHFEAKCPDCGQMNKEDKKPLSKSAKESDVPAPTGCATGSCPFVS